MSTSPRSWSAKVAAALLVVLAGTTARAQVLRERDLGETGSSAFGFACANVGDVDLDGIDDFIVGAQGEDVGGVIDAGQVTVYSGASGLKIRSHDGGTLIENFGITVAGAGDVDGDSVPDYVVGSPYSQGITGILSGIVMAFSGATGAEIWRVDGATAYVLLGISLAGIGDVDGDGRGDVVVADSVGDVYVVGAHGDIIHYLTNESGFGTAVAGGADLDGDGVNDFVVGDPFAGFATFYALGAISGFSGATGNWLYTLWGSNIGDMLGTSLARLGDVDGDGVDDFIAGGANSDVNGGNSGIIRIFSGSWGGYLLEQAGETASENYGSSVCAVGDVNVDGVPDYAVGAVNAGSGREGRVCICSGSDGSKLHEWLGAPGLDVEFGCAVAGGDWNGDGVVDLLMGDFLYGYPVSATGSLDVVLLAPAWWRNFGTGWPGKNGIPAFTSVEAPQLGAPLDLQLGNSLGADTLALLFVGTQTTNVHFNNSGTLWVAPTFTTMLSVPAAGLALNGSLPDDPALAFFNLELQAIEVDGFATRGLSFTPGLELHFGFDL